jgi:hypothetical protein
MPGALTRAPLVLDDADDLTGEIMMMMTTMVMTMMMTML